MTTIRYAVIGSGWRSLFYYRIAKALPEHFTLTRMLCRSQEKADRLHQEYGICTTTSEEEVIRSQPDFIVSAVSKTSMCETCLHWMKKGFYVLSETPAALSFQDLTALWQLQSEQDSAGKAHGKLQVAEQYQFYPWYHALIRLMDSGILGDPVSLSISAMHDYHAASIIRRLLNINREEMRLTGNTFLVPVTDTRTRYEVLTAGKVSLKDERHVFFEFEKGKTAVYDFMSDQYRSPIRGTSLNLRGTRGELLDRTVHYLNEKNLSEKEPLKVQEDPSTGEVLSITFKDQPLYLPPFGPCGLSQDETAIAYMLQGMKTFMDTGKEIYPLAEALEDAYIGLLMTSPAVTPGAGLSDSGSASGASPSFPRNNGWFCRTSSSRPWKSKTPRE